MTPSQLALDTSAAVPLLVTSHSAHRSVVQWWAGRPVSLCGHALVETYSVLTRLPGDARLAGADAARLIEARFDAPILLPLAALRRLPRTLADRGIAGGATYDAITGLAAKHHDATLVTRDARALATYHLLGVTVELVPEA